MTITKEKNADVLTVTIEGNLDINTAPKLTEALNGELDDVNQVIFDLEKTDYTSSAGLNSGDTVYLYTDGVTEARNFEEEMFGEERLIMALNKNPNLPVEELDGVVRQRILEFADGEEQYDDTTSLCLRYLGK